MANPYVLEAKLRPPQISGNLIRRQRVIDKLSQARDYRLTILQAGAGYGKSTALTRLSEEFEQVIWYQISDEDQDPFVFLLHLCYSTALALPEVEGLPTSLLETWENVRGPLMTREIVYKYLNAVGSGLNQPAVVVLDDVHIVSEVAEIAHILDRLIGLAPANLHFVLSTRHNLQLPNLFRWRSLGQVIQIDQKLLSFTADEIEKLFTEQYGVDLSKDEVAELYAITEGWAISLQLIWQSLNSRSINSVKEALTNRTAPLDSLFEILANDVLKGQQTEMQRFLCETAVLRTMTPNLCDWLLEIETSEEKLNQLVENDLFVDNLGRGEYRYHPIFQQFLYQQLDQVRKTKLHLHAAAYFSDQGEPNFAIYHYLKAEDLFSAAELLNNFGGQLHAMGHLDTLANYLEHLSPEALRKYPTLMYYLGDLARLHSRFQEALGWYQQAEALWRERGNIEGISRSLRGQARVYLDTVNPSKAEELLQQTLRLSDGTTDRETHARTYQLLAENKLNAGKVDEAEVLRRQAELLRQEGPDDSQLWYRVLLRTGRLEEARRQLEKQAAEETTEPVNLPRSHRETQLLLSLIYAMQGEAQKALEAAREGIRRGKDLASPFITAVGYMREGHALMMQGEAEDFRKAKERFEQVIEISRELSTPRLRVEAFWGLTRYYGYRGDLEGARNMAQKGIAIANQAGDEWIASLIRLAMGASCLLAGQINDAAEWLDLSLRGFQECSDPFGASAVRLWQCYGWILQSNEEVLLQALSELLATCQQNFYNYLFTMPTLLGFPDNRLGVPLLIWAREQNIGMAYPDRLLALIGLEEVKYHPGYRLNVKVLGQFEVSRGREKISHSEWRREKTRQLFQLFVTYRHAPLDREQICDNLWPGTDLKAAERHFKVVLNTLYGVLEPQRKPGEESAYVLREGAVYGLRPGADIWIDADQFDAYVGEAEKLQDLNNDQALLYYRQALELYEGEYLPEARYQDWSAIEREHFAVNFLSAADKYCDLSLKKREYHQAIEICQRILSYDSCWERAYRYLMIAYDKLGDHGQVARTYQRCTNILKQELNIQPADETTRLFRQLTESDA